MMTLLSLLFFAAGTGMFTALLFFAMGDPQEGDVRRGRIGSWLGVWLLDKYNAREVEIAKAEAQAVAKAIKKAEADHRAHIDTKPGDRFDASKVKLPKHAPVNWWKLFVCPVCLNTWLSLVVFAAFAYASGLTGWWWLGLVPFLGWSTVSVSLAARYTG
jgi:hypothetical protein